MAARDRVGLAENTRKRIQASMLVNRLQDHIVGKIELSQSQVNAINILLKKTVPDLSAIHHTGNDESESLEDWIDNLTDEEDESASTEE